MDNKELQILKEEHANDSMGRFLAQFINTNDGKKLMDLLHALFVKTPELNRCKGNKDFSALQYQVGQEDVYHMLKFRAERYIYNATQLGE